MDVIQCSNVGQFTQIIKIKLSKNVSEFAKKSGLESQTGVDK